MKKILIFVLAICSTQFANAQNFIEDNYQHFLEKENITAVHVSGKMFDMIRKIDVQTDDQEMNEIIDLVSSIHSFDLIAVPELSQPFAEYKTGLNYVGGDFEELVRVRDEGNTFSLHIDEDDNVVHEIVGLGSAEDKFIAFSLKGEIDLDEISKIINKIQSSGVSVIKEVTDAGLEDVKVYPNPVVADGVLNIEVPENMIGGNANVYDLNGNLLKSFDIEDRNQKVAIDALVPGQYVVEMEKESLSIRKKVVVIK